MATWSAEQDKDAPPSVPQKVDPCPVHPEGLGQAEAEVHGQVEGPGDGPAGPGVVQVGYEADGDGAAGRLAANQF